VDPRGKSRHTAHLLLLRIRGHTSLWVCFMCLIVESLNDMGPHVIR
jgi:hypothetical protein